MATLLQRPPLAMFDPSLIHRNDEIFNPEPNRLGIFFALHFVPAILHLKARIESKNCVPRPMACRCAEKAVRFSAQRQERSFRPQLTGLHTIPTN